MSLVACACPPANSVVQARYYLSIKKLPWRMSCTCSVAFNISLGRGNEHPGTSCHLGATDSSLPRASKSTAITTRHKSVYPSTQTVRLSVQATAGHVAPRFRWLGCSPRTFATADKELLNTLDYNAFSGPSALEIGPSETPLYVRPHFMVPSGFSVSLHPRSNPPILVDRPAHPSSGPPGPFAILLCLEWEYLSQRRISPGTLQAFPTTDAICATNYTGYEATALSNSGQWRAALPQPFAPPHGVPSIPVVASNIWSSITSLGGATLTAAAGASQAGSSIPGVSRVQMLAHTHQQKCALLSGAWAP